MPTPQDPYDILGVAPTSEDVVIRAAWRALMRKYLAAEHGDPLRSDQRASEVNAAYELLADPVRRLAYDKAHPLVPPVPPAAPATPAPQALAAIATARAPPRLTPERQLALGGVVAAVVCLGAAALALGERHAPRASAAPQHGLKIHRRVVPAPSPLPCYVDGQPVGKLPLPACAARNGVATGPLETGIEPAAATERGPSLAVAPARAASTPPPAPSIAYDEATSSMALARAFYGALGGGDGYAAAAMIEPEKRASGALSAAQMSRFYGSLREPLHLTSMYALAPDTVFVRYRFTTREGGVCLGAANVTTTARGGHLFIHAIRAHNGC